MSDGKKWDKKYRDELQNQLNGIINTLESTERNTWNGTTKR